MSDSATSTGAYATYGPGPTVPHDQSNSMNPYAQYATGAGRVANYSNQQAVGVCQPPPGSLGNRVSSMNGAPSAAGVMSMVPQAPLAPPPVGNHVIDAPGLKSIWSACSAIYPKDPDPLQVASLTKFWLGGPDPLDFISMYLNNGVPEQDIPPHWHYVSFGLSDLYGDGRVHPLRPDRQVSGFGFELTFRLKREPEEQCPPTWPATVMQSLAKYVFTSNNNLCPGDHVSWHCSLDNSESRIQHMLMTEDPQLGSIMTPNGKVTFIQIVGVCYEELQAAQQWNGAALIGLMKTEVEAGGLWLVTDMRRGLSIFEIDPQYKESVEDGIAASGSDLSGVTAKIFWSHKAPAPLVTDDRGDDDDDEDDDEGESIDRSEELKDAKGRGLNLADGAASPILSTGHRGMEDGDRNHLSPTALYSNNNHGSRAPSNMSVDQVNRSVSVTSSPTGFNLELNQIRLLSCVHLMMNLEAGNILVLALRGRLMHKRHFTFKTVTNDLAVTILTEDIYGSYVSRESPYAIHGPWLQVLIPSETVKEMLDELSATVGKLKQNDLPKRFSWPRRKFYVTILPDTATNAATSILPAELD